MATDPHLTQIVRTLAVVADYYGKPVQAGTLATIARDLEAHPIDAIQRAVDMHRCDPERGRFFPLTADLMVYLAASPEDQARAAWDRALRSVKRFGKWTGIAFDDVALMATIEGCGGWVRLCLMTDAELPFRQREFEARYADAVRRPPAPGTVPKSLPGMNTDGAIVYIGVAPAELLPEPVNTANVARLSAMANGIGKGGGMKSTAFLVEGREPEHATERRRGPYARRNAGLYREVDLPTFLGAILLPTVIAAVIGIITSTPQ